MSDTIDIPAKTYDSLVQADLASRATIKDLKSRLADAEKQLAEAQAINKHSCEDWAEDDTDIRNLCRPIIGEKLADHDGYAVIPIQDAVKSTVDLLQKELAQAQAACSMLKSELIFARDSGINATKIQTTLDYVAVNCTANWLSPDEAKRLEAECESQRKQIEAYTHFIHSVSNLAAIGDSVLKLDFRKLSKEELATLASQKQPQGDK